MDNFSETPIKLLAHHLYAIFEELDELIPLITKDYSPEMAQYLTHLRDYLLEHDSLLVKVTIRSPDSICNPKISLRCKECLHSLDMGRLFSDSNKKTEVQARILNNKNYKKIWQIVGSLDETLELFYYNLEPKMYSVKFLRNRVKRIKRILNGPPSGIGYSTLPVVIKNFPAVAEFVKSDLIRDFIDRVISESIENEIITDQEILNLIGKYPRLFAKANSDKFYYEVKYLIKRGLERKPVVSEAAIKAAFIFTEG